MGLLFLNELIYIYFLNFILISNVVSIDRYHPPKTCSLRSYSYILGHEGIPKIKNLENHSSTLVYFIPEIVPCLREQAQFLPRYTGNLS